MVQAAPSGMNMSAPRAELLGQYNASVGDQKDAFLTQKDGTTIISIKYNGGILIGADARSSNVSLRRFANDQWT